MYSKGIVALFGVLSRHLAEGSDENHENRDQDGRFKTSTYMSPIGNFENPSSLRDPASHGLFTLSSQAPNSIGHANMNV